GRASRDAERGLSAAEWADAAEYADDARPAAAGAARPAGPAVADDGTASGNAAAAAAVGRAAESLPHFADANAAASAASADRTWCTTAPSSGRRPWRPLVASRLHFQGTRGFAGPSPFSPPAS